jgi:surfeit locus 1 family protein
VPGVVVIGAGRWLVLAASLAAAAVTARLGWWQLDRAQQKISQQAQVDARSQLPPLPLSALSRDEASAEQQWYRPVELRGRWLVTRTVYLDNRSMNGRAGFVLATPLLIGEHDAVLVQRGWAARDARDPRALPRADLPDGPVTIAGRLAPWPSKLLELGEAASGPIRQNLDPQAFSREVGVPLRPLSVQQSESGSAAADGLIRQWQAATLDPGKNRGYAFQWFALSALVIGLTVWFQLIRPRRHARST